MNEVEIIHSDMSYQCNDIATVPFDSYRELEDKYEALENEFEEFKQDVFNFAKDMKFGELVEYLKLKGVF